MPRLFVLLFLMNPVPHYSWRSGFPLPSEEFRSTVQTRSAIQVRNGMKLTVVVRTYDTTGVSSRVLDRARAGVDQMLNAVGIQPVWRSCAMDRCMDPLMTSELDVRIANATPLSPRDSLGSSEVDLSQRAGTLATIYQDRVRQLARAAGVDEGQLLGRTIAHEVGHLLLGSSTHARTGLMRARWDLDELRRDRPFDWRFSAEEGSGMRWRLLARTEPFTVP
jgi:hypothetical protein